MPPRPAARVVLSRRRTNRRTRITKITTATPTNLNQTTHTHKQNKELRTTTNRMREKINGKPTRCGFSSQEGHYSEVKGAPFSVVCHHSRRLGHRPRLRR